ncbi:MAG: 3-hydroxyacyl-CoA dehydrogenase family protein [Halolamina sp.]|uniref:3-hydroxyacyl-CoA dehydrogenase family protein n=1 Tax=Halolamina sp. TaxID=1940283 RepID=UPI002FC366F7
MKLSVIGAGTMGHGIAQVGATAGYEVALRDVDESVLEDAVDSIEENLGGAIARDKLTEAEAADALDRIETTVELESAVEGADLVVEAVPEDEELKQEVLGEAELLAEDQAVLATNTSSLPVTSIASSLDDPSRLVGLHFFNPVHIMALVEVVVAEQTSDDTVAFAEEFVEEIGKTAVVVEDAPGFATSRLGAAQGVEAIRMVQAGVAAPAAIDDGMELGYRHPMGPLQLTDVVGLDVRLDILEHLREELGERFRPPALLRRKVRAGKLGKKTGEGFYVWEDGEAVAVAEEFR